MNDADAVYQYSRKSINRRVKILFFTLSFFIIAASSIFFILSLDSPSMGVVLSLDEEGWKVQSVDPDGAASQAGIEIGDRPEMINGQEAESLLHTYHDTGYVVGVFIHDITVIDGNGQLKTADIDSSSMSLQSSIELLTWIIACIIFWATGLFVYSKKPENASALLLLLCGLDFGLALSANMAGERAGLGEVVIHTAIIASTIGPWLLLHFAIILPEERVKIRSSRLTYLVYLPAIITVALYPIFGFADGQPLQDFRTIRILGYGIGFLAVVGVSIFNYVYAKSIKTRQQMKIILIGSLTAIIPILFLSVLPATAIADKSNVMPASFSILFLAFFPLSMGYAIVNKRLMDIDIFIRRSVIYSLITLFMAIILVIAISLALVFRESPGILERILAALILGAFATALFGPVKKWIEDFVDRLFFKDRYDYRTIIKELSDSLNRLNDISSASSIIVSTLMNTLKLSGACLFIETEKYGFQASAAQGALTNTEKQKQLLKVISRQFDNKAEFPNSALNVNPDIAFLIPLMVGDSRIGIIILSPKISKQDYLPADMYLIQDLSIVAATSLRSMLVIADDIAERKRADEAIKHAIEEWRVTFDSITDMIAIIDTEHRITRINKSFAENFNISPNEAVGKCCHEIVHSLSEPHLLCNCNATSSTNKSYYYELFEPKIGKHLECTVSPLFSEQGNATGVVRVLKDITKRKEMEAEQKELRTKAEISSRLASVGEMAAGIAHEINNPLTGVIGFSQLLLKEDLEPRIKEHVNIIAEGSNRVKDIVKRMLTFARQAKPHKSSLDIHKLIDNTLELRSYVLDTANIEVIKNYDTKLPHITVDPGQMQQVFINLIVNAEYSMKKAHGRGKLIITSKKEGGYIVISFKDDGNGMPKDALEKLFHPFFTTKDPGEGTGLGLSLSHSIILEHGGIITGESEPGQGATFIIKLPIIPQAEAPKPKTLTANNNLEMTDTKASILVIDDEAAVRALLENILTSKGHSVEVANEFNKAIEKLKINNYDIVLLDMRMPGMSGKEFYDKIIKIQPEISNKVIFITGDASDANTLMFFKENNLPFIAKPFDNSVLIREINKILKHS